MNEVLRFIPTNGLSGIPLCLGKPCLFLVLDKQIKIDKT